MVVIVYNTRLLKMNIIS